MKRSLSLACLAAVATASPLLVCGQAQAAPPAQRYTVAEVDYSVRSLGIDSLGDYVTYAFGVYSLVYGKGSGGASLRAPSESSLPASPQVRGISDRGVTAGSYIRYELESDDQFNGSTAVTWTRAGVATTLSTPPKTKSQAADANDRGAVVGCIGDQFAYLPDDDSPTDQCVATVWRNGTAVPLGPVGSEATLVNNAGKIVGAVGGRGPRHAVVFTGRGSYRPLRELPGTTASEATALNGKGAIVGVSTIAGSPVPTFWDGRGRAHRLAGSALPVGINDHGTIAGNGDGRAVLWSRRTASPQPLPTLAYKGEDGVTYQYAGTASGINDRGTVVGDLVRPQRPGSDFNTRNVSNVVLWTRT